MINGRVLVVDDDVFIRDTVRQVLQRAGYEALLAANGQEAITLLAQIDNADRINAVLCDLDMPNVKGVDLINHIYSQYPSIPIVVLSGTADEDYLAAITLEGVSDWLRKPVTNASLLEKIGIAVRLHCLRKKNSG